MALFISFFTVQYFWQHCNKKFLAAKVAVAYVILRPNLSFDYFKLLQLHIGLFRDRFRHVFLMLNFREYIDGVLKTEVNFEFLLNLFASEIDTIHKFYIDEYHQKMIDKHLINLKII